MSSMGFPFERLRKRGGWNTSLAGKLGLAALVVVAALAATVGVQFFTEWLWFESLGLSSVYLTILSTQVALFASASLVFLSLFIGAVVAARRLAYSHRQVALRADDDGLWSFVAQVGARVGEPPPSVQLINRGLVGLGVALAIIMGLVAMSQWDTTLRLIHGVPFQQTEPIFGQDLGFYVFQLPLLRAVHSWLLGTAVLVTAASVAVYAVVFAYELGISLERAAAQLRTGARLHLALLGAALMLLMSANHVLDLYELTHSTRGGIFYGPGYTDVHAQAPAFAAMAGAAVLAAALLLAAVPTRSFRPPAAGIGLWAAVALVGGLVYPTFVQNVQVEPNELDRERPFIANSIHFTRLAYGLADVEEQFFPAEDAVSPTEVQNNAATIENIRLWDHRPLRETLNQIQSIRTYYGFHDVDVDRYVVDGRERQVMLAPRELVRDQLPANVRTWVNEHLQFTHGYGVVMTQVNAVAEEGRPQLLVQDVPPQGVLAVERPELYYGERTDNYVVVRTAIPEFDYPSGDENATTSYQGDSGVPVGPWINRLAFSLRLQDPNLLLSDALTEESRLKFRRSVTERIGHVAPFLLLDRDPYIVLANGRLVWMQDAYTYTSTFPYAQPRLWSARGPAFNYIRNSVKITLDAYDGSIHLYAADPDDPLLQTYQRMFPGVFEPLDAMPPELRAHLRYPEDLFAVQANVYQRYHMQDPTVFYNGEDEWSIPLERFYDDQRPVEPYYVIMRLPGEERPEFLLMQPFTPVQKDNMIAWLAGRADEPNYGRLLVFKYPKDKLVYGPIQVEGRIDQNPAISAQFSLWSQAGSQVLRGNLLVIPLGNANLYVEPIYLQAQNGALPELKRVVVSTGNRVVMEPTLEEALAQLFVQPTRADGDQSAPGSGLGSQTAPSAPSGELSPELGALARAAQQHYEQAQSALRDGNWAVYGEELRLMEQALARMVELTGAP